MLTYQASSEIEAPEEKIWEILTHSTGFSEWDPYCERIEGDIKLGAKLVAYTTLAPGRAFSFRVTQFQPYKIMVWSGGMPLGLFKGERSFKLETLRSKKILFTVKEEFSGLLLPVFGKAIPDMNEPFAQFVSGLKNRAEST